MSSTDKYILLVSFLLRWSCAEATCLTDHDYDYGGSIIKCSSVDVKQVISFIYYRGTQINNLLIENSSFHHMETLPSPITQDSWRKLVIRKSGIKTIDDECFKNSNDLYLLDLSYNAIKNTSFLRSISRIGELILSHNEIEYFDGNNFNKFVEIYRINLSHNKLKSIDNFMRLSHYHLSDKLRFLNVSHNSLTNLGNILVNFENIEGIDLSYNKLKNLHVENFSASCILTDLNVSYNELINMDDFKCLDINIHIIANNNRIKHFNITVFNKKFLDLANNNIEFHNKILDMPGNIDLDTLDYSNNSLNNLDFMTSEKERNIRINSLILKDNNITEIIPHNFENITMDKLDLSGNNITHLHPESFLNSRITELNLSHNPISHIEKQTLITLSQVRVLDLSYCNFKELNETAFRNLTNLRSLNLNYNGIKTIQAGIFGNLEYLDLSYNLIACLSENSFSGSTIGTLDLGFNQISSFHRDVFNDSNIHNLLIEGLVFSEMQNNHLDGLNSLESLNFSNKSINKLHNKSFDSLKSLNYLYLDDNHIEILPKQFLVDSNLEFLSLKGNNISNIDRAAFSYKLRLKQLNITISGKISKETFAKLTYLTELNIIDSHITNIENGSFRGLVNLKTVTFTNSVISGIEPGAFVDLFRVYNFDATLFGLIRTLKPHIFMGLERLEDLNLSNAAIRSVENDAFAGLKSLENLNLSRNKIEKLSHDAFKGLSMLKILDLSFTHQGYFKKGIFRDLDSLEELHLQHNKLSLETGTFSNLINLQVLNLSNNNLGYMRTKVLFPLKNLRILDIRSNNLNTFDYIHNMQNIKLSKVGISSNNWDCNYLLTMLKKFQVTGVDYKNLSDMEYKNSNIDGIGCTDMF